MAPIVMVSSRRRTRRSAAFPVVMAVIVILAAVTVYMLMNGRVPSDSQVENAKSGERLSHGQTPAMQADTGATLPDTEETNPGHDESDRDETPAFQNGAPTTGKPVKQNDAIAASLSDEEKEPRNPQHFPHESERLLSMVMSVEPGMEIPPVPLPEIRADSTDEEIEAVVETEDRLKRDLAVAATNDIVVYDTDDEKLVETKMAVADVKSQLAEIVRQGGNVTDAIMEYTRHANEGARLRSETLKKITPIVDAITNDADAVEYVESVNEALQKEDIPPIRLEDVGFEEVQNAE